MNKIGIAVLLHMVTVYSLHAQQDAHYTQYMYNTAVINPAYTGSRGVLNINGLHRSQWVGLDGAPKTQTFSMHGPVGKRVGLGLAVVNDQIGNGANQDTFFDAAASYTVPTSETANLSFGIKAGLQVLETNFNRLRNYRPNLNRTGLDANNTNISPSFGAGVYYHTNSFYVGVSVPNIFETEHFDTDGLDTVFVQERMHFYVMTGYVFKINPALKFKPAALFKAVEGAPFQVDVSANFLFQDKFTLGAAYRWDAAVSALVGFQVTDRIMLGLAYDKETTRLGGTSFNGGSFELLLRYEFFNKLIKVKSSRFF